VRAYHSEMKCGSDKEGKCIKAEIWVETKKNDGRARRVKFSFSYNCIPYLIDDLRKVWKEERDVRVREIDDNNQALGL
jgi:hypothetical protein